MAQLAPDNKIYVCAPASVEYLHVIHNPDEKGDACNVEQHGILLPTLNGFSMPNFPNFRLGKWEGSLCDSIISSTQNKPLFESEIYVYPNPATDFLFLNIQSKRRVNIEFSLFNALGQRVLYRTYGEAKEQEISLSGVEAGIYFYTVEMEGVVRKNGKVIVQK
ncbi:MAG: T9SS C-terminal target domain-containing protein [Bacteroidetes bacterium]|nr:MAG: T9SS C-terminal target domain-containing protein [Bacteroidota bacterium]